MRYSSEAPAEVGAGVLIRAIQPTDGIELMKPLTAIAGLNTSPQPGRALCALSTDRARASVAAGKRLPEFEGSPHSRLPSESRSSPIEIHFFLSSPLFLTCGDIRRDFAIQECRVTGPARPRQPLTQENESPAVRRQNDEQHRDERQVIRPALAVLTPKAGLPNEDLLLNRTKHDEYKPDCGELLEHAQDDSGSPRQLGRSQKDRKVLRHSDTLAASSRIAQILEAAVGVDRSGHEPKQEESVIRESIEMKHALAPWVHRGHSFARAETPS